MGYYFFDFLVQKIPTVQQPIIINLTACPFCLIVPPLIIHLLNTFIRVLLAVFKSAPATATPFMLLSHPAGSASVVIAVNGTLLNAMG